MTLSLQTLVRRGGAFVGATFFAVLGTTASATNAGNLNKQTNPPSNSIAGISTIGYKSSFTSMMNIDDDPDPDQVLFDAACKILESVPKDKDPLAYAKEKFSTQLEKGAKDVHVASLKDADSADPNTPLTKEAIAKAKGDLMPNTLAIAMAEQKWLEPGKLTEENLGARVEVGKYLKNMARIVNITSLLAVTVAAESESTIDALRDGADRYAGILTNTSACLKAGKGPESTDNLYDKVASQLFDFFGRKNGPENVWPNASVFFDDVVKTAKDVSIKVNKDGNLTAKANQTSKTRMVIDQRAMLVFAA